MNSYDIPGTYEERKARRLKNESEFLGKTIKSIFLNEGADILSFSFTDESGFDLILDSDCCAYVYFSTPDNLEALNGEIFRGLQTRALPDREAGENVKEAAILIIKSDKDSIELYHYNEHNGYYSGTSYTLMRNKGSKI
jgi:hypothetical protein